MSLRAKWVPHFLILLQQSYEMATLTSMLQVRSLSPDSTILAEFGLLVELLQMESYSTYSSVFGFFSLNIFLNSFMLCVIVVQFKIV